MVGGSKMIKSINLVENTVLVVTCLILGNGMAVTDCLSTNEDVYYTLSGSLEVYEYDVNGKPFTIFKAELFQKGKKFNSILIKKYEGTLCGNRKEQLNNKLSAKKTIRKNLFFQIRGSLE